MNQQNVFFTNKKIRVSFILSILVFIIHISSLSNYNLDTELGKSVLFMKELLDGLAKTAVPLFMIISGALFFRNYTYQKTTEKIKSRIRSLVIPYLIWNIIWMAFEFFCSYTPISNLFIGREKAEITIANVLLGIFHRKYNLPFWFIEDLIVFTLICPVTFTLVKNKKWGIFTLCVLAIGDYLGIPHFAAYLFYCLGAYIGVHYFRMFCTPVKRTYSFFSLAFLIFYVFLTVCNDYIATTGAVLCVAALAMWLVLDLISGKHSFQFERCSFLIYAMHMNVGAVVTKLIALLLPRNEIFAMVNFVMTIIITVFIICTAEIILYKYMPRLRALLCGR